MRFSDTVLSGAILLALIGPPATAHAHALLLSSMPAEGSVVEGTNVDMALTFDSRIDARRSRLTLREGPAGNRTENGGGSRAGQDIRLPSQHSDDPAVLKSHADGLPPGEITVHWEVLSIDGHVSSGDLHFIVKAR